MNLNKDIPADTLKLDNIFFHSNNRNDERGEWVELLSQVDMLQAMNGNFIQGYVFAKPMSLPEFEKLVFPDKEIQNL